METLKVVKGYDNDLKFTISVSGVNEGIGDVRLLLSNSGYNVLIDGEVSGNEVKFSLNEVLKLFKEGTYPAKVEVFIRNQRFVPFECLIEVVEPVKVVEVHKRDVASELKVEVKPVVEEKGDRDTSKLQIDDKKGEKVASKVMKFIRTGGRL